MSEIRTKIKCIFLIINHNITKGQKETFFFIQEVFVICISIMVLQVYTNAKTNQVAYFKYVKLIAFQLFSLRSLMSDLFLLYLVPMSLLLLFVNYL